MPEDEGEQREEEDQAGRGPDGELAFHRAPA
jgi:hypothetical protein